MAIPRITSMAMMTKLCLIIDALVISLASKIAYGVQWAGGPVCYRLAEQAFTVSLLGLLTNIAGYWIPQVSVGGKGTIMPLFIISVIGIFHGIANARRAAKCAEQWSERKVLPTEVWIDHIASTGILRAVLALVVIVNIGVDAYTWISGRPVLGNLLSSLWIEGVTTGGYFMRVIPKPRQRMRVLVPVRDAA